MAVCNDNDVAGASVDASDLEPDEVQVVTLWDREARKDDIYKVAYSIFSRRRFDSPSVAVMRDWLKIFVAESPQDFFLNGSRQIENFQLLMTACRFPSLSKAHLYVSIIEDMYTTDTLSQDYLAHCMEQAEQDLN